MNSGDFIQPMPTPNCWEPAWEQVIKDLEGGPWIYTYLVIADARKRDAMGAKKYGTRLQPFNGRDALLDAYEEALDLCVYLRCAFVENDSQIDGEIYDLYQMSLSIVCNLRGIMKARDGK